MASRTLSPSTSKAQPGFTPVTGPVLRCRYICRKPVQPGLLARRFTYSVFLMRSALADVQDVILPRGAPEEHCDGHAYFIYI